MLSAIVLVAFAHAALGYGGQSCLPEPVHLYTLSPSAAVSAEDAEGVTAAVAGADGGATYATEGVGAGVAQVRDSNVLGDCNGDGQPGDYDGDLDIGVGGGFFGSGTTWEALCAYGHNVHGTTGTAVDVTGLVVQGTVGVDDQTGPIPPVVDPTTGETLAGCQTDGAITPDVDPSDCLASFAGAWAACSGGVGGDDGYWIYVDSSADVGSGSASASSSGAGTLTVNDGGGAGGAGSPYCPCGYGH